MLGRAGEIGPGGVWLMLRTFALMLFARLALHWVPVTRVIAWKQRPLRRERALPPAVLRVEREKVRHAVLVVARYSPVRFVCFPQCLAASALLRRRGIASRLHYGVARAAGNKLVTHTWLEAGGEIVIGGEVARDYATLAVY